ncbi:MAG TPA: Uma2 family endonuclease [Gemmatimonadales bacterium]|nr:Uma2 family endonuclease [Gemmatimonadales bacterium]
MAARLLQGRLTVEDYYRLAELGILGEDDRVELLDGQIVEMTPIGPRHVHCVNWLNTALVRLAGDRATVSPQNPVIISKRGVPQPDLVLLKPRPRRDAPLPTVQDVLLVIEVSDTTVGYDRDIKVPLYARARIPEVWLVDLPDDCIRAYRTPIGDEYADVRVLRRGDTLSPSLLDGVTLSVDDILG